MSESQPVKSYLSTVLILCLSSTVLAENEACSSVKRDLVILLDSSGSVAPVDFEKAKQFLASLIQALEISDAAYQIAVVRFSLSVKTQARLGQYNGRREQLVEKVRNIFHNGGGTNTAEALEYTLETVLSSRDNREDAPDQIIILTDGRSDNVTATAHWASRTHARGVEVMVIGVGRRVNDEELRRLASSEELIFKVESYADLRDGMKAQLIKSSCKEAIPFTLRTSSTVGQARTVTTLKTTPTVGTTSTAAHQTPTKVRAKTNTTQAMPTKKTTSTTITPTVRANSAQTTSTTTHTTATERTTSTTTTPAMTSTLTSTPAVRTTSTQTPLTGMTTTKLPKQTTPTATTSTTSAVKSTSTKHTATLRTTSKVNTLHRAHRVEAIHITTTAATTPPPPPPPPPPTTTTTTELTTNMTSTNRPTQTTGGVRITPLHPDNIKSSSKQIPYTTEKPHRMKTSTHSPRGHITGMPRTRVPSASLPVLKDLLPVHDIPRTDAYPPGRSTTTTSSEYDLVFHTSSADTEHSNSSAYNPHTTTGMNVRPRGLNKPEVINEGLRRRDERLESVYSRWRVVVAITGGVAAVAGLITGVTLGVIRYKQTRGRMSLQRTYSM